MQPETIVQTAFLTFFGGGLVALVWNRLNRIEETLSRTATKDELNSLGNSLRSEFDEFRAETRAEFSETRAEFAQIRGELASMRSDLTHVALAVGARKPRASEG